MFGAMARRIYRWLNTPYPTPGTGNQAFDWFQELPRAKVQTPGLLSHKQFINVMQPQVVVLDTQTTQGLGGLVAGQYVSQPLVADTDNSRPNGGESGNI